MEAMRGSLLMVFFLFLGVAIGFSQNLDWLLQQAESHHPDLQAIQFAYEAQLQRIEPAGSLSDPEIGIGLFPMPMQRWMGRQWVDIALRQKFPWKGTLKAARTTEEKKAEGVLKKYDQLKAQLFYQIKQEWWYLHLLSFKIEILERHLELIGVLKNLAEEKIANNLLPTSQFIELKLQENARINELENLRQQMAIAQLKMVQLTKTPDWAFEPLEEWEWLVFPADALSAYVANNPDIQFNRSELGVYQSMEKSNELKGKPSFGVGLQYSVLSKVDRPDLNPRMNGMDMWMPMATVSVPINRKKYDAAVQEMKWYQRSKEMELEGLLDFFSTQIELGELQIEAFANSTGSLEAVMTTRQRLLDLQIKALETKWEASQIVIEVEKILGR
jgi:cobalt-zinc-cadmium efflux system outer membrane protein